MLFRSDRKSTRLNSSHTIISYAVFCLKKRHVLVEPGVDPRPAIEQRTFACHRVGATAPASPPPRRAPPVEPDHAHDRDREENERGPDVEQDLLDRGHEPLDAAI